MILAEVVLGNLPTLMALAEIRLAPGACLRFSDLGAAMRISPSFGRR